MREGSLEAPIRHTLDWQNPWFWDEAALEKEMERVFDVCHGCRRCFNLCDSFPRLFDLIDNGPTGELDGVHFVLGCNGSGVSMMPYLGDAIGRSIAGRLHGKLPFGDARLPAIPLYSGNPWFLPAISGAFRALDWYDERVR